MTPEFASIFPTPSIYGKERLCEVWSTTKLHFVYLIQVLELY